MNNKNKKRLITISLISILLLSVTPILNQDNSTVRANSLQINYIHPEDGAKGLSLDPLITVGFEGGEAPYYVKFYKNGNLYSSVSNTDSTVQSSRYIGLSADTTYNFTVEIIDSNGNTVTSTQKSFTTKTGVPWDLNSFSYDGISYSIQGPVTGGMFFSDDGKKMYEIGEDHEVVYQHSLSTAWDISTASYDGISYSIQGPVTGGMFIRDDGKKMYEVDKNNCAVFQHSLSTAWDISTASYDNIYQGVQGVPDGMFFRDDGKKMYEIDMDNDVVYQHSLSTAWDISTVSYDSISYSLQGAAPKGMFFRDDGKKMYEIDMGYDVVYQHSLSTAWDITTASYDNIYYSVQGSIPTGMFLSDDGKKMYEIDRDNDVVYQHSISQPVKFTDLNPTNNKEDVSITPNIKANITTDMTSYNATLHLNEMTIQKTGLSGDQAVTFTPTLNYGTEYSWYVSVSGTDSGSSEIKSFTTTSEPDVSVNALTDISDNTYNADEMIPINYEINNVKNDFNRTEVKMLIQDSEGNQQQIKIIEYENNGDGTITPTNTHSDITIQNDISYYSQSNERVVIDLEVNSDDFKDVAGEGAQIPAQPDQDTLGMDLQYSYFRDQDTIAADVTYMTWIEMLNFEPTHDIIVISPDQDEGFSSDDDITIAVETQMNTDATLNKEKIKLQYVTSIVNQIDVANITNNGDDAFTLNELNNFNITDFSYNYNTNDNNYLLTFKIPVNEVYNVADLQTTDYPYEYQLVATNYYSDETAQTTTDRDFVIGSQIGNEYMNIYATNPSDGDTIHPNKGLFDLEFEYNWRPEYYKVDSFDYFNAKFIYDDTDDNQQTKKIFEAHKVTGTDDITQTLYGKYSPPTFNYDKNEGSYQIKTDYKLPTEVINGNNQKIQYEYTLNNKDFVKTKTINLDVSEDTAPSNIVFNNFEPSEIYSTDYMSKIDVTSEYDVENIRISAKINDGNYTTIKDFNAENIVERSANENLTEFNIKQQINENTLNKDLSIGDNVTLQYNLTDANNNSFTTTKTTDLEITDVQVLSNKDIDNIRINQDIVTHNVTVRWNEDHFNKINQITNEIFWVHNEEYGNNVLTTLGISTTGEISLNKKGDYVQSVKLLNKKLGYEPYEVKYQIKYGVPMNPTIINDIIYGVPMNPIIINDIYRVPMNPTTFDTRIDGLLSNQTKTYERQEPITLIKADQSLVTANITNEVNSYDDNIVATINAGTSIKNIYISSEQINGQTIELKNVNYEYIDFLQKADVRFNLQQIKDNFGEVYEQNDNITLTISYELYGGQTGTKTVKTTYRRHVTTGIYAPIFEGVQGIVQPFESALYGLTGGRNPAFGLVLSLITVAGLLFVGGSINISGVIPAVLFIETVIFTFYGIYPSWLGLLLSMGVGGLIINGIFGASSLKKNEVV